MPLRWQRGSNPYIHHYFGRLRLGPNANPRQIVEQAKSLRQKLGAGKPLDLGGQALDEHAVGEAAERLREPGPLAEELLLVHAQPAKKGQDWKVLVERLRRAAAVSDDRGPLPLVAPTAILWFTPAPGPECAELPEFEAFGLVGPGDPEDLALDIVFDC